MKEEEDETKSTEVVVDVTTTKKAGTKAEVQPKTKSADVVVGDIGDVDVVGKAGEVGKVGDMGDVGEVGDMRDVNDFANMESKKA